MATFAVIVEPDPEDGGWNVTVPARRGCFTCANTFDEALARAKEAIEAYLDADDVRIVLAGLDTQC